ncbi:MAG: putative ATP-dependent RNA helicase ddx47 [Paramarteilia canceri]
MSEDLSWQNYKLHSIIPEILKNCGWDKPTKIQAEVLPYALEKKDIIGIAETGSGKTGAFALPVINDLLEEAQSFHTLILTPTRELAFQIKDTFNALGGSANIKCGNFHLIYIKFEVVLVGGIDNVEQALALSKSPHVIIATPGRLIDHLENTKGFNLKKIKYLIIDEADRILNMDYEKEVVI